MAMRSAKETTSPMTSVPGRSVGSSGISLISFRLPTQVVARGVDAASTRAAGGSGCHPRGVRKTTMAARRGGRGDRGAHPGNDLKRNPCRGEGESLFPAPSQNERIATLEAGDTLPAQCGMDHDAVNGLLWRGLASGTLTPVAGPRPRGGSEDLPG